MIRTYQKTFCLRNNASLGKLGAVEVNRLGFFCTVFFWLSLTTTTAFALEREQADAIPHVNQEARENFVQYIYAQSHKAFAIAPGGAWSWVELESTAAAAQAMALQHCQSLTEQRCVVYALNDKVVFDKQAWSQLWRLDKQATSLKNVTGITRGATFPNLLFKNSQGKPLRLSDFRGKPTLLHFWGSWCAPCLREMPTLLQLQQALKKNHGDQINMVLLQVREPFNRSLQWARQQQFDQLPLYDSGVKGDSDSSLFTATGKTMPDRQLARAFPTSYVLDHQGRVLFTHTGPIASWLEYLPLFKDVIEHNGG